MSIATTDLNNLIHEVEASKTQTEHDQHLEVLRFQVRVHGLTYGQIELLADHHLIYSRPVYGS